MFLVGVLDLKGGVFGEWKHLYLIDTGKNFTLVRSIAVLSVLMITYVILSLVFQPYTRSSYPRMMTMGSLQHLLAIERKTARSEQAREAPG